MTRKKDEKPVEAASSQTPVRGPDEKAKEVLEKIKAESPGVIASAMFHNPFDPKSIKWKPQVVKGNRALAIAYVDARLIMDRLDKAVGVENWEDDYREITDTSGNITCVVCTISVCIGGNWIDKADVGSPSEQPDSGDRIKAAFSDAFKRAAVKFGIGRYLYRLPAVWVDYDPTRKQIVQPPQLPPWALPKNPPPDAGHSYWEEHEIKEPVEAASTPTPVQTTQQPAETYIQAGGRMQSPAAEKSVDVIVKEWRAKVSGCGSPDELNAMIPALKLTPDYAKVAVWDMIKEEVLNEPVNWVYDAITKKFGYRQQPQKGESY